jgi:hypothetical protein
MGSHIAKAGGCGRYFPDQGTADISCPKCVKYFLADVLSGAPWVAQARLAG